MTSLQRTPIEVPSSDETESESPDASVGIETRCKELKHDFFGLGLTCVPDAEFLALVRDAVASRSRITVSFVNPDYMLRAHRDSALLEKMSRFDLMLPDGWGIVLGGRWMGLPVPDRQGNDDICPKLFDLSVEHGISHFLFGCDEGVPDQAAENLKRTFPGLSIAGTLHGYWDVLRGHPGVYEDADLDMMVDVINASHADVLHVSIPTPMQQSWVWEVSDRLNVPVIITGGSYLDHLAERVYWYPRCVNRARLGWAYRLWREPRRLWKRYSLDMLAYGRLLAEGRRAIRRENSCTSG